MVKINWIKKLKIWLKTQKEIIKHLQELDRTLDIRLDRILPLIEELDPTKTYFLYDKTLSDERISYMFLMMKRLESKVKWTLPTIIFSSVPIQEYEKRGKTHGTRNL